MFRLISIIALCGTTGVLFLHYAVFSATRLKLKNDATKVRRFSFSERGMHAINMLVFVILVATGFWPVIALSGPIHGWLWLIHAGTGSLFGILMVLMTLFWARDCTFRLYDWTWARHFGGYLNTKVADHSEGHLPAGRFNAGQKAYFWSTIVLGVLLVLSGLGRMAPEYSPCIGEILYQIHRFSALAFAVSGIIHLYLATLANPGTIGAMIAGTVSQEWIEHHHPVWWDENNMK